MSHPYVHTSYTDENDSQYRSDLVNGLSNIASELNEIKEIMKNTQMHEYDVKTALQNISYEMQDGKLKKIELKIQAMKAFKEGNLPEGEFREIMVSLGYPQ